WAIGIGAKPDLNNSEFIFCSFTGQTPTPMSYGIDTYHTTLIQRIDGFQDPSICGETYAIGERMLYRRNFLDTVWYPINFTLGNFESLKAREDNKYVYAGGAEGYTFVLLIRSSDNGTNWEHLNPYCSVYDLDFFGQLDHKIIVTDRFKIMSSSDSGVHWSQIFRTDSLTIQNISYSSDGQRIFVVTNTLFYGLPKTYFFVSSDNGNTWETLQLPIYDLVIDMDIDTEDAIYLASISSGVFRLKFPIVAIEDAKKNFPNEYQLHQNYPNPFNPNTVISYQLPVSGLVSLKVYDILGNEVATLVNEYRPAGKYNVEFHSHSGNVRNLSSGVYFYTIKAGSFVETKKMILLR
ncbi:MAG: T9SS type A sorting domain-containing protein, partial [Ignavibacteriaceae bacterium]|nr:T9SS type A sorting domain-containing protein [Ignavibacteriaceae bacterium]